MCARLPVRWSRSSGIGGCLEASLWKGLRWLCQSADGIPRLLGSGAGLGWRHQVFDADGEVAHTDAGGVVNGGCDGCGDTGHADLSDAAGAEFVDDLVGIVEEGNVDLGRVCVGGAQVIGEVIVYARAVS